MSVTAVNAYKQDVEDKVVAAQRAVGELKEATDALVARLESQLGNSAPDVVPENSAVPEGVNVDNNDEAPAGPGVDHDGEYKPDEKPVDQPEDKPVE